MDNIVTCFHPGSLSCPHDWAESCCTKCPYFCKHKLEKEHNDKDNKEVADEQIL